MQLNLLNLDNALIHQPGFLRACQDRQADTIDAVDHGSRIRLWGTFSDLSALKDNLRHRLSGLQGREAVVTWMGSGDFHHVSAVLVALLGEARQQPVTVVMFDNHPDWVTFRGGVHCGSWVNHALKSHAAQRVVGVGMSSRDLAWPEFKKAGLDLLAAGQFVIFPLDPPPTYLLGARSSGPAHSQSGRRVDWTMLSAKFDISDAQRVYDCIQTEAIYITVDKDVLVPSEAATNWDQGKLRLEHLISWIRYFASRKTILGVDIVGDYSRPTFGGSVSARLLKNGEIVLDHPAKSFTLGEASAINERTNVALLTALGEALC